MSLFYNYNIYFELNFSKKLIAVYKLKLPFPYFFKSSYIYEIPWLLSKRSSLSFLQCLIVDLILLKFDISVLIPIYNLKNYPKWAETDSLAPILSITYILANLNINSIQVGNLKI